MKQQLFTPFKMPATATCVVVWYRKDQKHETTIPTPATPVGLRDAMIKKGVGYSEIRAVKADPNGVLRHTEEINPNALRHAMMAC